MSTITPFEVDITPRRLVVDPPMSDAELESFCSANDLFQIERSRDGVIWMNPPAGRETTSANSEITGQLYIWWREHERGQVADSSGGFYLADGSMLSPDAAYLLPETLTSMKIERRTSFYTVRPDFVIELLSPSDSLRKTQAKMESWLSNGVQLSWLIDPFQKQVFVYRADAAVTTVAGKSLDGVGPVEGFVLDLTRIWRYYEE
jgi:Uma2 family endonuclease